MNKDYQLGLKAVATADNDPEHTMGVHLTEQDLAVITFGSIVLNRIFPECVVAVNDLNDRLMEVSAGQGFLLWSDEDMERLLGEVPEE